MSLLNPPKSNGYKYNIFVFDYLILFFPSSNSFPSNSHKEKKKKLGPSKVLLFSSSPFLFFPYPLSLSPPPLFPLQIREDLSDSEAIIPPITTLSLSLSLPSSLSLSSSLSSPSYSSQGGKGGEGGGRGEGGSGGPGGGGGRAFLSSSSSSSLWGEGRGGGGGVGGGFSFSPSPSPSSSFPSLSLPSPVLVESTAEMLQYFGDLGDVQMCVSVLLVLQNLEDFDLVDLVDEKRACFWFVNVNTYSMQKKIKKITKTNKIHKYMYKLEHNSNLPPINIKTK